MTTIRHHCLFAASKRGGHRCRCLNPRSPLVAYAWGVGSSARPYPPRPRVERARASSRPEARYLDRSFFTARNRKARTATLLRDRTAALQEDGFHIERSSLSIVNSPVASLLGRTATERVFLCASIPTPRDRRFHYRLPLSACAISLLRAHRADALVTGVCAVLTRPSTSRARGVISPDQADVVLAATRAECWPALA